MENLPEYFLTSARLGFRRWRAEDLPLAIGLWGDPEVTRLIDARGRLDKSQVRQRLELEMETAAKYGVQYWPVIRLRDHTHVGCCGVRPYDLPHKIYEIGFHIRSACWGRGYATEAARAVIVYGFEQLGAAGLFAGHNPRNIDSRRLLLKLGFGYTHDEFYAPTGLQHPSYALSKSDLNKTDNPSPEPG